MKISNLEKVSWEGVSHNPEIRKKVLIRNGEIPKITVFGKAVFKSGQSVDKHSHETMYEVFLITKGKAVFVVNEEEVVVKKGDCVVIEPKEVHSQANPYNNTVEWIYFGVATE